MSISTPQPSPAQANDTFSHRGRNASNAIAHFPHVTSYSPISENKIISLKMGLECWMMHHGVLGAVSMALKTALPRILRFLTGICRQPSHSFT
jgi:hypothetical protein